MSSFQEALDKLTELCERGDEMIKNDHYYSQSIKAKCNELQGIHNELNKKFDERKHNLDKSTEVHESLHQVSCKLCLVNVHNTLCSPRAGVAASSC
jgi:uncharacterized coiled-coil DUF342 family protein